MARSHPETLLRITLEGQIHGKKAYGRPRTMLLDWLLKTEEGNQLRRTKDVRPGQVYMTSMKMETCHMAEHYRESPQISILTVARALNFENVS